MYVDRLAKTSINDLSILYSDFHLSLDGNFRYLKNKKWKISYLEIITNTFARCQPPTLWTKLLGISLL